LETKYNNSPKPHPTRPNGLLQISIRPIGLIVIILLFPVLVLAQTNPEPPGQYIKIGIAPTFYHGDLISRTAKLSSIASVGIRFNQKQRLNGTFQISFGALTGQNPGYQYKNDVTTTPNTFFRTSIVTIHYDLAYNFICTDHLKVFAGLGIGLLRYQPKDDLGENLLNKIETRAENETYANTSAVIPVKIGASYFLENNFGVEFQTLLMNPQTDYIDNIGEWGNNAGNDQYFAFQLSIMIPLRLNLSPR